MDNATKELVFKPSHHNHPELTLSITGRYSHLEFMNGIKKSLEGLSSHFVGETGYPIETVWLDLTSDHALLTADMDTHCWPACMLFLCSCVWKSKYLKSDHKSTMKSLGLYLISSIVKDK